MATLTYDLLHLVLVMVKAVLMQMSIETDIEFHEVCSDLELMQMSCKP